MRFGLLCLYIVIYIYLYNCPMKSGKHEELWLCRCQTLSGISAVHEVDRSAGDFHGQSCPGIGQGLKTATDGQIHICP